MTRGVADPGLGPGVQRRAVAGLPALQVAGRGLELLGADVRRGAQLELGAALLPVQIGPDPPAQQPHRLQRVQTPADRAVMAIAILPPLPPIDPPRRMQRRQPGHELAHARHDRPPRPPRGRQPAQEAKLGVAALERSHVIQPPGRELAPGDPLAAHARQQRQHVHRLDRCRQRRRLRRRARLELARAAQTSLARRICPCLGGCRSGRLNRHADQRSGPFAGKTEWPAARGEVAVYPRRGGRRRTLGRMREGGRLRTMPSPTASSARPAPGGGRLRTMPSPTASSARPTPGGGRLRTMPAVDS